MFEYSVQLLKKVYTLYYNKMKYPYSINGKILNEEKFGTNFFSKDINFSAMDLVYLFKFLETDYHIKFREEEIMEGNFVTVDSIAKMVLTEIGG